MSLSVVEGAGKRTNLLIVVQVDDTVTTQILNLDLIRRPSLTIILLILITLLLLDALLALSRSKLLLIVIVLILVIHGLSSLRALARRSSLTSRTARGRGGGFDNAGGFVGLLADLLEVLTGRR